MTRRQAVWGAKVRTCWECWWRQPSGQVPHLAPGPAGAAHLHGTHPLRPHPRPSVGRLAPYPASKARTVRATIEEAKALLAEGK